MGLVYLERLEQRILLNADPVNSTAFLDNLDPSFQAVGQWIEVSSGYEQHHYEALAQAGNAAYWKFDAILPGYQYVLSSTWQEGKTNSPYVEFNVTDILSDGTEDDLFKIRISQQAAPDDFVEQAVSWENVGQPFLVRGHSVSVELSGDDGGLLVADGLRLQRLEDWQPPAGIPSPKFGIEQSHYMYVGRFYDYGAGLEPYRDCGSGPYTHYIDNTSPNATDDNNPFGTLECPRMTVPVYVTAGSVVEIHGGPYSYGGNFTWFYGGGTDEQPVFIRGSSSENKVVFHEMNIRVGGQYMIVENIDFDMVWLGLKFFSGDPSGLHHDISFRHNEMHNLPPAFGSAFNLASGHNIVMYDNYVHDNGDPDYFEENDLHGMSASAGAKNLWIVDNYSSGNGGDSVQINSKNVDFEQYARYVYIGRNIYASDGENAVDIKQARDVIISENRMYDYHPAAASDGTAVVVHNRPYDVWILNNEIFDSNNGIRSNGSIRGWIVGNFIHDIRHDGDTFDPNWTWAGDGGSAIITWQQTELYVVGNTLYHIDAGFNSPGGGQQSHNLINNIIADLNEPSRHVAIDAGAIAASSIFVSNLLYQQDGDVRIKWDDYTYTDIEQFILMAGTGQGSLIADPEFLDDYGTDAQMKGGSAAMDSGTEWDYHIRTFYQLYGLNISSDWLGRGRPNGSGTDIGAFEILAGDANNDKTVDLSDFILLANHWRQTAGWEEGNFNSDEIIDLSDMVILARNWSDEVQVTVDQKETGIISSGLPPAPEPFSFSPKSIAEKEFEPIRVSVDLEHPKRKIIDTSVPVKISYSERRSYESIQKGLDLLSSTEEEEIIDFGGRNEYELVWPIAEDSSIR